MKKYLNYKDLGIKLAERKALIKTYKDFGSPKIRHNPDPVWANTHPTKRNTIVFNMATTNEKAYCGTVMCIGGHMAHVMRKRNPDHYVTTTASPALTPLFYPSRGGYHGEYYHITKAQARTAIRNFLTTGIVDWHFASRR